MKIINIQQGSPEWKAHRKTTHNASDYPSAQGVSKKFTRSELIAEYATGIEREFSPFVAEKILENGHRVEALARPMAEEIIGEDLYPLVAVSDDGYLGASSDGATMLGDIGFECKQWNEELADSVRNGIVPETHVGQLDQQTEVFNFEKILFMVTDGTPEKCVYCWHISSPEARAAIRPTWAQFDKDVESYVPSNIKEMPKADVTVELPALFVHAKGEITTHNMDEFGEALAKKLAETRAIILVTDQDFSNAKESAKKFRETAKAIALSKEQMLAQTETIGEAARKMDSWAEDLNKTALQLEKDVEREDRAKKEAMILTTKNEYIEYVAALELEIRPIRLTLSAPDFANAIKGKRSYVIMQDAVNTMLANAKIDADSAAKDIRNKLAWCKENASSHGALFPDLQQIITKPMDDFTLLITSRIDKAKADEAARIEAERERIRQEEIARINAEQAAAAAAKAKQEAEERARQAETEARNNAQVAESAQQAVVTGVGITQHVVTESEGVVANHVVSDAVVLPINDCLTTINLGEICARLGFTVTANFLSSIGINPVETEKNAKLYDAQKFPTICRKISEHVLALAFKRAA